MRMLFPFFFVGRLALMGKSSASRLRETCRSRYLRIRALDKYKRVHQSCSVLHASLRLCNRAAFRALGRLRGILPFTVVVVRISQLESHRLFLARTRTRTVGHQGFLPCNAAASSIPSKRRTRIILLHRLIRTRIPLQRTIPMHVASTARGTRSGCRGGRFLALMMTPGLSSGGDSL